MHIEILVEDRSGTKLIESLMPQVIGIYANPHTWRIHPYKGCGQIPKELGTKIDPAKRALLNQLPRLLAGYGKTAAIDAVVVVLDNDNRDCEKFLAELNAIVTNCNPPPKRTLFRLAIEETEAWFLGDLPALLKAYPNAKKEILNSYTQDSVCGTWELLADAIYPGGSAAIRKAGWPLPGQVKHEWAEHIAPHMNVESNHSHSFCKFRDGLRRLVAVAG